MAEKLNKRSLRREAIYDEIEKNQYCSVHSLTDDYSNAWEPPI